MALGIKPLDWQTRDDGVVHADPDGLEYAYYIEVFDEEYELALVRNDGSFDEDVITNHHSLDAAKIKAEDHYYSILKKFIVC